MKDNYHGSPRNRTSITVPMSEDMKVRITKAAGRSEVASTRYIRDAVREYMERHNEWSIPGPKKGNG